MKINSNHSGLLPVPGNVLFKIFKSNADKYVVDGCPSCDQNAKPLVELFNKVEGLATVFCCEGRCNHEFYFMFGVNEQGIKFLYDLHNKLINKNNNIINRLKINFVYRLVPRSSSKTWYPAYILEYDQAGNKDLRAFHSLLLNTLQEMVDETIMKPNAEVIAVQKISEKSLSQEEQQALKEGRDILSSRVVLYEDLDDDTLHMLCQQDPAFVMEKRPDWVKKHYPDITRTIVIDIEAK